MWKVIMMKSMDEDLFYPAAAFLAFQSMKALWD